MPSLIWALHEGNYDLEEMSTAMAKEVQKAVNEDFLEGLGIPIDILDGPREARSCWPMKGRILCCLASESDADLVDAELPNGQ